VLGKPLVVPHFIMKEYHEGEIILCTVTDIVKTTVFVETEDGKKGSIVFSEVAPGRIRNIRDYVVPQKIIVCKVLNIAPDHLFLSLRRVKDKEKKEMLEVFKREKRLIEVMKKLIGENSVNIVKKINEKYTLAEFIENARENPKIIEEYFDKEQSIRITDVLKEKKEKEREIKQEFLLSSKASDGIIKIKKILSKYNNINYLGSSKYVIKIKSTNLKQADSHISEMIEDIEKQAKKEKCEFAIKK
jgi:translation initiation factor 2 alpha subunit (eIF-2alpha)